MRNDYQLIWFGYRCTCLDHHFLWYSFYCGNSSLEWSNGYLAGAVFHLIRAYGLWLKHAIIWFEERLDWFEQIFIWIEQRVNRLPWSLFLIGVAAHLIDNVAHLIGTSGVWFGISFHFAGSVIHLIDTGVHLIESVIVCLERQIVFDSNTASLGVMTAQLIMLFDHPLEFQFIWLKQVFSWVA